MKKVLYTSIILYGIASCSSTQNSPTPETIVKKASNPVAYANTITAEEIKEMLYVYASDEFAGRETGTASEKKAVEYLKNYYVTHGISAAQSEDKYYQTVPLVSRQLPNGYIRIHEKDYAIGEHFAMFSATNFGNLSASEIVYAGYGIETKTYSDYDNIDVTGKLVFVKMGEPKNEDGTYTLSGSSTPSKWSNIMQSFNDRLKIAENKKALGLIFYDATSFPMINQQFNYVKENSDEGMIGLRDQNENISYVFIDKEMANAIYPDIDRASTAKTLTTNMHFALNSNAVAISSENVIAYVKGSEKPNEYIIISAHLDHVGVDNDGNVFNGADDDGSGTIAILEIAEAFKKASADGNAPKRSVVFLHVTGEEKGLLGSDYYTQNPVFSLENTVANLNIDMIGRIDPQHKENPNYVYLIGSDKLSTELHNVSEAVNATYTNITLDYTYNDDNDPNRFYYRSDHYNFAKNNIPVIFYFNGTHEDYHKITDTPDKINYELLTQRAKLVFHTAWELANREARIVVDKAKPLD